MVKLTRSKPWLETLPRTFCQPEQFNILHTAREFREQILRLIKDSRQRIYMTALYLQDDEAGREILTALFEAKQKNPSLEVKLFVDYSRAQRGLIGQAESIGNVRLYRELHQRYEHSVEIIGIPVKTKEVLGVLHLKGFVFDDTVLYSGASLNNVYLQQAERYRCDRYHQISSAELADAFVQMMRVQLMASPAARMLTDDELPKVRQLKPAIQKQKLALRRANYRLKPAEQGSIGLTPLLGFGGRKNPLNRTIIELLRSAQNHIVLFTPYFNLPRKMVKALLHQLKKGVTVEIIVGDKTANDFYIPPDEAFSKIGIVPYLYEDNLRRFALKMRNYLENGQLKIQLWKHDDNSFHLKGVSVDDSWHLLTGHNLNPRACRLDLENAILVFDPEQQLAEKFRQEKEHILQHTKPLKRFDQLESAAMYPAEVQKLLRSVKRSRLNALLNRLL